VVEVAVSSSFTKGQLIPSSSARYLPEALGTTAMGCFHRSIDI
jgi:hypothetical protein